MGYQNPSVTDFKSQFTRDFPYGTDPNISVLDSDITGAFVMTNINIDQSYWPDQGSYTLGYNLLSAHYLVMNLRASSQGINGQYNFLQQGKGVGSVNESFAIPEEVQNDAFLADLFKTNYGSRYYTLIAPQLRGQMFNVYGTTRP